MRRLSSMAPLVALATLTVGVAAGTVATTDSSGPRPAAQTNDSAPQPRILAINCPNTWQLTSEQLGLNPGTRRSELAAGVIPPDALWAGFCLYGFPSSAASNAAGTETLVLEGGNVASKERSLITEINSGQVIDPHSVYVCPDDNGQTYLLMFTYRHQPTVRVAASLSGCAFITNGITTVRSPVAHARLLAMAGSHTHGGPPLPTTTTSPVAPPARSAP